jgi:hypothetical protein
MSHFRYDKTPIKLRCIPTKLWTHRITLLLILSISPENYDVWNRGHLDYDSLTKSEAQLFAMLLMRVMGSFMTTVFHYDQGSYKNDCYQGLVIFYSDLMATPGGTRVYQKHLALFPESVRRKIDETNLTHDKGTGTQPPPNTYEAPGSQQAKASDTGKQ